MIVACALTEPTADDAITGISLVDEVDGHLTRVTADPADDTLAFDGAAGARGARVVVPPTKAASLSRRGARKELLHREPAFGVYRLDFQREELLFLKGRAAKGVVEDVPVTVRQHAPLDPCRAEVGGELLDVVLVIDGAPESLGLRRATRNSARPTPDRVSLTRCSARRFS